MRKSIVTIGLLAFLAIDIVLVYLALRPPKLPEAPRASATPVTVGTEAPTPTESTSSTTSSAPPTSSTTKPTGGPTVAPAPLEVMIAALDRDTAWRATAGTCTDGGSSVQMTTDGGKTWSDGTSPAQAITRVQPLAAKRGFVLGGDDQCRFAQYTTTDGGSSWSDPGSTDGAWGRKLGSLSEVFTPARADSQPCGDKTVVDLARSSATDAEALCADGKVRLTQDGGDTWSDAGKVTGALAIANRIESDQLVGYAARVTSSCAGVQVVRIVRGGSPEVLACVSATLPDEPGSVALSTPTAGGWLLVGRDTFTSGADLTAWKAV